MTARRIQETLENPSEIMSIQILPSGFDSVLFDFIVHTVKLTEM